MARSPRPPHSSPSTVQAGLMGAAGAMVIVMTALLVARVATGSISKTANIAVLAANIVILAAMSVLVAANRRTPSDKAKED